MKNIIYNPIYNKMPIGAVTNSDAITITISINKDFVINDIRLVIHKDYTESYNLYSLIKIDENETYNVFQSRFQIREVGIYWYNFEFYDCYGKHYISCDDGLDAFLSDSEICCWQLSICDKFKGNFDWYKGKIMYQIFPDRFCNGGVNYKKDYAIIHENWNDIPNYQETNGKVLNNDFFGGDLKGIISKLDYLKELNVGVIYLNPIFTAYSNHKYDTGNYEEIDPMFGTIEDFKNLCSEAKKKDIRIIIDGVFNHTGDDSIYFNKYNNYPSLGAYQSKESQYYNWYKFKYWPNNYECWWNFQSLPNVNQKDKSYIEYIAGKNGILNKWLNLGASGWRFDVIDELDNDFINRINKCIKNNNEDYLLLGEVWEDASNKMAYNKRRNYLNGNQLDTVMNYFLRTAIIDYIKNNNYLGLRNTIRKILNNYPKHTVDLLMNPLSTHDTIRALTSFSSVNINYLLKDEQAKFTMSKEDYYNARQKLKMATVLQFTLPGVPSIFYGDEAGVQGYRDPFCRKAMPWDHFDESIYSWYKKLTTIRKSDVFTDGEYKEELCENGVFAFSRNKNGHKMITIVNNSNYDYHYKVDRAYDIMNEVVIKNYINIPSETALILKVR